MPALSLIGHSVSLPYDLAPSALWDVTDVELPQGNGHFIRISLLPCPSPDSMVGSGPFVGTSHLSEPGWRQQFGQSGQSVQGELMTAFDLKRTDTSWGISRTDRDMGSC